MQTLCSLRENQHFTPDATMLCFSCLENKIDNKTTGLIVTTAKPMIAFYFVLVLFEIL